jgi:hypothetical protein
MKVALAGRNLRRSGGRLWVSLFDIMATTRGFAQMGRRQILTSDPADKSDRDVMEGIIDLESKPEYLPIGLRVSVIFLE